MTSLSQLFVSIVAIGNVIVQQPPRDPVIPQVGTASLSGTVHAGEQPVSNAHVTLFQVGSSANWSTTSDPAGKFVLDALPSGAYTLRANKAGWLEGTYAAKRPGGQGAPITLGPGQNRSGLSVPLWPGCVISGTIRDRHGNPLTKVWVTAFRKAYLPLLGSNIINPAFAAQMQQTDDTGKFRIYGLLPGEYVVAASSGTLARLGTATQAFVDLSRARGPAAVGALQSQPDLSGYPTEYFPGTADLSRATSIQLRLGERRTDIDFSLEPVRLGDVTVIVTSGGQSAAGVPVTLTRAVPPSPLSPPDFSLMTNRDGEVTFPAVPAGDYIAAVRGDRRDGQPFFGSVQITTEGSPQSVSLPVKEAARLVAQIESGSATASNAAGLIVGLRAFPPDPWRRDVVGVAKADGTVVFEGVVPGTYKVGIQQPAITPRFWFLQSVVLDGREVLDEPALTIGPSTGADRILIRVTDHPTEVSGRVIDPAGSPLDTVVVLFPEDHSYWTPLSRRIKTARPAASSEYTIKGVPSGIYYLSIVRDIEEGQEFDPTVLAQLTNSAITVHITEGAPTLQDLVIGR